MDYAFLKLKTAWGYAKLERKLETFKQAFYVYFEETYGRPYVPTGVDPKRFDPNQPRVPAGNGIFSGRWAKPSDGGVPPGSREDHAPTRIRVAQMRRQSRGRSRLETIRDVTEARASAAIQRVQRFDPNWRPTPSAELRNSLPGQIQRAREHLREAQARLHELQLQCAPKDIRILRERYGTDLLGRPLLGETDSVAHGAMDGQTFMGVNSGAIVEYSQQDFNDARRMRGPLVQKHPDIMSTSNLGWRPNDALFHAEATVLFRAARANGGTLAGKTIDVTVDRPMCPSCKKVLPLLGKELGNPTVTFRNMEGKILHIMRDGAWLRQTGQ